MKMEQMEKNRIKKQYLLQRLQKRISAESMAFKEIIYNEIIQNVKQYEINSFLKETKDFADKLDKIYGEVFLYRDCYSFNLIKEAYDLAIKKIDDLANIQLKMIEHL